MSSSGKSRLLFSFVLQAYDRTLLSRGPNNYPVVTCAEGLLSVQSQPGLRHLRSNEEMGKFLKDVSERDAHLREFNNDSATGSSGSSRSSTPQTAMPRLLPATACCRLTTREPDRRRRLSAPSSPSRTRSRTSSVWTAGGHASASWLNCTQTGQTSTTTRRRCLGKPNGSDGALSSPAWGSPRDSESKN